MKFNVQVQKRTSCVTNVEVEAVDRNEAERIVQAYDYESMPDLVFDEHDEEYEIVSIERKE